MRISVMHVELRDVLWIVVCCVQGKSTIVNCRVLCTGQVYNCELSCAVYRASLQLWTVVYCVQGKSTIVNCRVLCTGQVYNCELSCTVYRASLQLCYGFWIAMNLQSQQLHLNIALDDVLAVQIWLDIFIFYVEICCQAKHVAVLPLWNI